MQVSTRGYRSWRSRPISHHRLGIAANWLAGDFVADMPNRKWAGDITYIWTSEGWLYLAVILDLHSRRVVGWAVSDRMKKDLAIRALDMAVRLRLPPEGCLFHSDRGRLGLGMIPRIIRRLRYCSYDYQKKLQAHALRPSMSGKGNCYDNASVEAFFESLKAELIWRQSWPTRRQADAAIFQYINGLYNTRRRHSYLGGISPLAFEAKVA
jgi:transposase InsO family protein